jgi:hypothetical protein
MIFQAVVDIPLEPNVVGKVTPITDLGLFVSRIASVGLAVAAAAFLIYLVYGGIRWILGNGDKAKIEEARSTITQGFLGLAVTAAAWAIFLLVNYFLGLGLTGTGTGGGAGLGGGGGSGAQTCSGGTAIGATASDGGAGGYCQSGAARVRCVGPGQGASKFNYPHYEPVCCESGTPNTGYAFEKAGGRC